MVCILLSIFGWEGSIYAWWVLGLVWLEGRRELGWDGMYLAEGG
jgi:hypothetical protein